MKFSRKKNQSKKAKAANLFKTYLEFKAVKRLAKWSPLLAVGAAAATALKKRRSSGEPAAV